MTAQTKLLKIHIRVGRTGALNPWAVLEPVGSTAVRESILHYQPMLSVHGHIHESRGVAKLEVLDDKALQKAGYGGIIGVGQGSSRPPRLVRLIHRGSKLAKRPLDSLIGE